MERIENAGRAMEARDGSGRISAEQGEPMAVFVADSV
jgi:hypothetical protein